MWFYVYRHVSSRHRYKQYLLDPTQRTPRWNYNDKYSNFNVPPSKEGSANEQAIAGDDLTEVCGNPTTRDIEDKLTRQTETVTREC